MARPTTEESRVRNAVLAWLSVALAGLAAARSAADGDLLWAGLGVASVGVLVVPAVARRRWTAMLPWEVALFAAAPLVSEAFGVPLPRAVATYLVVPALALAVAAEVDALTTVEMSPGFAVAFVVVTTMATAGGWTVALWTADAALGTDHLRGLGHAMWSLVAATATGIATGAAFAGYLRRVSATRLGFRPADPRARSDATAFPAERTVGGGRLSARRRRLVVRALQVGLAGALLVGLSRRQVSAVVNAAVALALLELPGALERDLGLPLDLRLTLWIAVPVFLHALGSAGLYAAIGVWDNLTHLLSSSLVAAAGYTTVRALDVHYDGLALPGSFVAGFILVFTLAFGVLWELLEFGLDGLATLTGVESVLAQHGLANTMVDLVFDFVGAVVVAVWGSAHLRRVSRSLADQLAAREESE